MNTISYMNKALRALNITKCPICGGKLKPYLVNDSLGLDTKLIIRCERCNKQLDSWVRNNPEKAAKKILKGWVQIEYDSHYNERLREKQMSYSKKLRRSLGRCPRIMWR